MKTTRHKDLLASRSETAEGFQMHYYYPSVWQAVKSHLLTLKKLGAHP